MARLPRVRAAADARRPATARLLLPLILSILNSPLVFASKGSGSGSRMIRAVARGGPTAFLSARPPTSAAAATPSASWRASPPLSARSFNPPSLLLRSAAAGMSSSSNDGGGAPLSDRVRSTLDPCVILMKRLISKYAHLWDDRGGIYSLAQGVVYWKPPPAAYVAITEAAAGDDALHTYCPDEGLPELIAALKGKVEAENGLKQDGVEIVVTSGANQAYVNCVLTLMGEGDRCVVFRPYYFNHVMAVQMTRGDEALLVGSCSDGGIPDLEWLRDQFEGEGGESIKVVTVVNPGNPTGTSLPRSILDGFVDLCREKGAWLVMDNTYEHFDHACANDPEISGVPFWCSGEDHVINIFSFSKAFALAGFRVGYVVMNAVGGRGKEAYMQMLKVQDTIPICPARMSQIAALGSLTVGRDWVADNVKTLDPGRDAILDALSPLKGKVMGGTGAMYVMAELPDGEDDQEVAEGLVERHGVAVIPGSYCGLPGWIRVCYSNLDPERCQTAAARLKEGIKEICSKQ